MALSLKDLGIVAYVDTKYEAKGGYERFKWRVNNWPKSEIAKEYDISRPWLDRLITEMPETDKPKEDK